MISGILLRHYKNYGNLKFIPICDSTEYILWWWKELMIWYLRLADN